MTDRYAVIGNPVAHSKSPWIHAEFARATGEDIEYGRIEAPPDGFSAAVQTFRAAGGKGLNVTLPFKGEAFRYSTRPSARAREAEAVNTLIFEGAEIKGDNTDGIGLVRDLTANLGVDLSGMRVLVAGAGGAARGVLGALLQGGIAGLVLANRTVDKARALAARYRGVLACGFDELGGQRFELVLNATSTGLGGESLALPPTVFAPGALAYDMVYGRDTPFLAAARAAGARTCDGLGMLVEQAGESFFLWRGRRPDTQAVLARLRAA